MRDKIKLVSTAGKSDEGMVFDFGDIKEAMTKRVHDIVDHGFMIYEGDEQMMAFFEYDMANHNLLRGPATVTVQPVDRRPASLNRSERQALPERLPAL